MVATAVAVGAVLPARSQVAIYPDGLPDGNYSGSIFLHVGVAALDLEGAGELITSLDAAGDATIVMDSDTPSLSGVWSLEGSGAISGSATVRGVTGTASGSTVLTGEGTFSGTPLEGRLQGTSNSEGSWTLKTPKGTEGPIPAGGPTTYDEPLTDILNKCSQVLGRWGSQLPAKMEALGPHFRVNRLEAYFVLSDDIVVPPESPMADRLRELAARGNAILADIRGGGDSLVALVDGAELLRDVEELQADIAAKESKCPADTQFQNILTQVAQDALDAILTALEADPDLIDVDAEALRYMSRLALGTGATGSGAQDTTRASELDSRMETLADKAFKSASDDFEKGDDKGFDRAVEVAAVAEQQGWKVANRHGITGSDALSLAPGGGGQG